jgi:hypothetical protein
MTWPSGIASKMKTNNSIIAHINGGAAGTLRANYIRGLFLE